MNSREIKVWQCSCCNKAYSSKRVAEECCVEKPAKACRLCGAPLDALSVYEHCPTCRSKLKAEKELDRYNKATHYTLENAPKDSVEYLYSYLYPSNEGFISDIDYEELAEYGIKYVYGTKRIVPSYSAHRVVEGLLEGSYEGADEHVINEEVSKLQEAINLFVSNHNGALDSYHADYSIVIDL